MSTSLNLPVVEKDLSGKTVAVIGANTGIGLETAKHFARMRPERLILACRTLEKGKVAVSQIESETGYSKGEAWALELSSFSSVLAFVERFEKEDVPLDILVDNAAIATFTYEQTADGWESSVQVNHLSQSLLTLLLLPRLLDTAKKHSDVARVVVVSSKASFTVNFSANKFPPRKVLHALNSDLNLPMQNRYSESKLLNVLFVRALTEHLSSTSPIVIDTVCPGFCLSELRRNLDESVLPTAHIKNARTSEEGSRQVIYAALAPTLEEKAKGIQLENFKGAFVWNNSIIPLSEWVLSEEGKKVQGDIWDETIEILSEIEPKVTSVVREFLQ
ncbi:hypothetical protein C8Q75DRAFT_806195 [Abortiporus biennis]|nr:hypothetical protein C8Q75DRAFT_806195 [Abortiporus biennis]